MITILILQLNYSHNQVGLQHPQSVSPSGNGSTSIVLRATDASGYSSNVQNWSIYLDTTPPAIQTSLNSTNLQINTADDCLEGYLLVQWETLSGQSSGWSYYNQSQVSVSVPFNGSVVKATVKSFDSVGEFKHCSHKLGEYNRIYSTKFCYPIK